MRIRWRDSSEEDIENVRKKRMRQGGVRQTDNVGVTRVTF
jgi:hypothetical protein